MVENMEEGKGGMESGREGKGERESRETGGRARLVCIIH